MSTEGSEITAADAAPRRGRRDRDAMTTIVR